jgi:hypothetical protein
MTETLHKARSLISAGKWLPTAHALQRLSERDILISDVLTGAAQATVVEDYPEDPRGPSVLVLLKDSTGLPVHAQWGIGQGRDFVSLVTVYRPDPAEWLEDNVTRRKAAK